MTKVRLVTLAILVVAGITALLVSRARFQATIREKDETILRQADQIAQLQSQNERLSSDVTHATNPSVPASSASQELLRLRGQVGILRQQTNELDALRRDNARLSQAVAESQTNQLPAEDQVIVRQTHAVSAMTTLLHAIKQYAINHSGQYPADLDQLIESGDHGVTNLAGNFGFNDFEFGQAAGVGPDGKPATLRLRVPIAQPGGAALMVVGGMDAAGVPRTTVWSVRQ